MKNVLVVEDDKSIADLLEIHLIDLHCNVTKVLDGEEGLKKALSEEYDLIVLDLMLPKLDGLEICKKVRSKNIYTPVLMLTSKSEELDKVLGLEVGADDYLTKPFYFRELLARIRAILRRVELDRQTRKSQTFSIGRIRLDPISRRVYKDHREIELSAREYDLLALLMNQAGQAISREALLEEIWGKEYSQDYRTLFVHIHWLRLKIEDDPADPKYIQNVRAFGYRFTHPESF